MRSWSKTLVSVFLAFCVLVTAALGAFFVMYPREWIDFAEVLYLVKKDFREPLPIGRMLDGAVAGLAEAAEDRYTHYLTPSRNKAVSMASSGLTGAIGVTIGGEKETEDRLVIREVRPGSGADLAGLRAEDAIVQVEDTPMKDLSVDEAVAMIRGIPDTYVRLLVAREGEADREYMVKRSATIPVETVQAGFLRDEYLPGYRIGYMFIDYFASNSGDLFDELLDSLLEDGAQGLVIDLRYNGGGDVAATAQIAGRLLPDGLLIKLVTRNSEEVYRIMDADPVTIPYILLVNGGSASASEILAGAVRDYGSGLLVGTRTYGKGSVQSLYTLMSGGGLRVTEGLYYLPGGECIDGEGIEPDYVVEYMADDGIGSGESAEDSDYDIDRQMATALLLLREQIDGDETVDTLRAKATQAGL